VTGPVSVRQAEARDRPGLLRLAAEQVADDATLSATRTEAVLDAGVVFVAEAEHHLAGYVALEERADTLVLHQLVVCQADDHRGVGNRLLDWAEGYGVSRGLRRVTIEVEDDNLPARSFYARRGYQADDAGRVLRELTHA
jgi:N-acetylglutamate synthase-like GNAT family acetyltransferase